MPFLLILVPFQRNNIVNKLKKAAASQLEVEKKPLFTCNDYYIKKKLYYFTALRAPSENASAMNTSTI